MGVCRVSLPHLSFFSLYLNDYIRRKLAISWVSFSYTYLGKCKSYGAMHETSASLNMNKKMLQLVDASDGQFFILSVI